MTTPAEKARGVNRAIAAALGTGYAALLLRSVDTLGYARDEGFYFHASSVYGRWFERLFSDPRAALARRAVDTAWSTNSEHPGLVKSLFALSNLVLQKKLQLFAMEGTSYRFPAIVLAGIAVAVVFLWGAEARGRWAGIASAVLLAAMPRFFFNAHLACFDVPILTMWLLTAYAYWKTLRHGGTIYPLATGLLFGLALDTKHNSWFLPIALLSHAVAVFVLPRFVARGRLDEAKLKQGAERAGSALAAMAVLGPLVLYAFWPWIWHDTLARLRGYAAFHLNHEYYNMELFGRTYWKPPMPRSYAWVMTLATVPVVTLLLFAAGVGSRVLALAKHLRAPGRGDVEGAIATDVLWAIGLLVNYAAWLSPKTPIFGGTKHWMTAYPFLALFAGTGFVAVVRAVRFELGRRQRLRARLAPVLRRGWPVALALLAVSVAAPVAETAHSHPWGLSAYTPLVGGAPGAATLGLNRTFWGYTTGAVVGYLNENAPPNAAVYVHDTAGPSWEMLVRDGRLRRDIRGTGSLVGAEFALYHHEQHMEGQEYQTWVAFGTARPDYVAGIDGVPVILVYRRPPR